MKRLVVTVLIAGLALPALAQDAMRDWDMHRDERRGLVMAYAELNNGLGIALRCTRGAYEGIITGLPAAGDVESRVIGIQFPDHDMHMQRWNVAQNDTVAVSEMPAPLARHLRLGGSVQIVVPGGAGEGRNLRYDLTLPASSASIDETLTRCNRPLVDPRDQEREAILEGGLPANLGWEQRPRPMWPGVERYARGFAVVTCLTNADGSLSNCETETEHPHDGGFGDSALRAVRRAKVRNTDTPGGPIDRRMISFRANFVMSGYQTREDREASRAQRDRDRQAREAN